MADVCAYVCVCFYWVCVCFFFVFVFVLSGGSVVVCLARNISYAVCVGQYITMLLNIAGGVIYDDQLYIILC